MNTIEIICTVIGAVAVILGGVWWIVQQAQKFAVNDYRLNKMESDVSTLKSDVSMLKLDMADMKADISGIKSVLIKNSQMQRRYSV